MVELVRRSTGCIAITTTTITVTGATRVARATRLNRRIAPSCPTWASESGQVLSDDRDATLEAITTTAKPLNAA